MTFFRQYGLWLLLTTFLTLQSVKSLSDPTRGYSWEGRKTDLSTILIKPYALPTTTDPKRADYLRRMNLENGAEVRGTHWITKPDVGSRDLFILDITQSLEGGFDSVNLYDKGIASWGIMQWAARYGSLTDVLVFVKRRLWAEKRKRLWDKIFVANGLDVDSQTLYAFGKPLKTAADIRLAFRGTLKVSQYDPKLMTHWALTLARAGRQPAIMALQVEYAGHIVDAVLKKRLRGLPYHAPGRDGLTIADLAANDPYAEALIFALWTNNPRHALRYISDAARAAHRVSSSDDPALWTRGAFSKALLRLCDNSRFGNWKSRAALIETREAALRSDSLSAITPFERGYQSHLIKMAQREAQRKSSQKLALHGTLAVAPKSASNP